jgi:hypothetical protein
MGTACRRRSNLPAAPSTQQQKQQHNNTIATCYV